MFDDIWELKKEYCDAELFSKPAREIDVTDAVLAATLDTPEEREEFLNAAAGKLCDPFLLPDMDAAVDRILSAIDEGEKIVIFGDYDCDGVTATALLYDFLTKTLDCRAEWHLPDRITGYGLSFEFIDKIAAEGPCLLVTVDCGISSADVVEYAAVNGIDVIVTDHHEVTGVIPECIAVIDPMRENSRYPNKIICGCTVAYKLCEAIAESLGIDGITNYLPLAGLATVGDMMKLKGENRTLLTAALPMMRDTMFPGLNVLIASAMEKMPENAPVTSERLSFTVVPMINAAGRLKDPGIAMRLLISETEGEALTYLNEIRALNEERKALVDNAYAEYDADPSKLTVSPADAPVVFVRSDTWPHGILGIVAAGIVRKVNRPVAVMAPDGEDENGTVLRASARSIDGVNIVSLLENSAELLLKFGGHEKAMGFSLSEANLDEVMKRTFEAADALKDMIPKVPVRKATVYLPPESVTIENAERLSKLEPFGEGNPAPVFITDGIESMGVNTVGANNKTLKFTFSMPGGQYLAGVNFRDSDYLPMLANSRPAAVVYTLGVNEYRGAKSVSLTVLDVIEGGSGDAESFIDRSFTKTYGERLEDAKKLLSGAFGVTKEELRVLYKAFASLGKTFGFRDAAMLKAEASKRGGEAARVFTWFKIRYALEIFTEAGILARERKGVYSFTDDGQPHPLEASDVFAFLSKRAAG
ncbi:MAG: single-stranded-DNA-specific exonuclease RecJ [Clostridia bacterium]|nr:single-stranded-DNA-specific exonuclease RecJ [Clostridia bacterium]